ncbi:PIN domain-containing protein [Candidatus Woesebacteria bacterium]|nr:PIN domain-containing protein [Candidatus Woesebacteria bacterium]
MTCYNTQEKVINYALVYNSTKRKYHRLRWIHKLYHPFGKDCKLATNYPNLLRPRNIGIQGTGQIYYKGKRGIGKTSENEEITKVVLDSSVLFTAADHPGGDSAEIIQLTKRKLIKVFLSRYILDETINNLREKSTPQACTRHNRNVSTLHSETLEPSDRLIEGYKNFINPKDAPVLALARVTDSDFLVTLDIKHFINNPMLEKLDLPFKIITPGKFILSLKEKFKH